MCRKFLLSPYRPSLEPRTRKRKDEERAGTQAYRAHGGILALREVEEVDLATSTHPDREAAWLMEKHGVWLRLAKVHMVLPCTA